MPLYAGREAAAMRPSAPLRGPRQRFRRPLAEGFAIIPREVSEVAETADKGDRRDGSLGIPRSEHFAGMPEPDHPCKSHRRIAAALLERAEDRTGADAGCFHQIFDRYRLVPMRLDELLRPAHMRGQRFVRFPLQEIAEGVTIGTQERYQNGLLEFTLHQWRQWLGGRVELFGKKKQQPPELLKAGRVSVDGALEHKLAARLRAEQIAQLAFERAAIDPHVEPFMAAIAGERDFLAGRDDATLIRIECDGVFPDRRLTLAREGAEQTKPFSLRKLAARSGAPIAIDKADVLKLNETASCRQSFGGFDLGIGRAVPRQQGMPEFLRIGGLKYRKPLQRIDERLKRHGSVCSPSSRSCPFKMPQVALMGVEAIGLYPLSEEAVRRTVASLYRFKISLEASGGQPCLSFVHKCFYKRCLPATGGTRGRSA